MVNAILSKEQLYNVAVSTTELSTIPESPVREIYLFPQISI